MTDDYTRAMVEAWADLCGVDLRESESDEELRSRILKTRWMKGATPRHVNCPCVSIPIKEPKPEILDITRDFIKERL